MARIFNIYFSYQGETYNGMVSVRKTPFFTEYSLSFDEELMTLLPSNKILSPTPHRFIFQHASGDESPLAQEIIKAVSNYLQAMEEA